MSAAPIPPDESPSDESLSVERSSREFAKAIEFHKDRARNKAASVEDRYRSAQWLKENTTEAPKQAERRRKPKAISQGNPTKDSVRNGRSEPKNLEAEYLLLRCLFSDPTSVGPVLDKIHPDQMAGEANRVLLNEIRERHHNGTPFDRLSVGDALARNYVFVEGGGPQTLDRIGQPIGDGKLPEPLELVKVIESNAAKRKLLQAARDVERRVLETDTGAEDLLSLARGALETIGIEQPNDWERPLLTEGEAPLPFPLEVLPLGLRNFVANAANVVHFAPDYLAVPCLTVAGAGIGRSVAIQIKESWYEYPCIFSIVVGKPGTAKSASIVRLAPVPLAVLSRALRAEYKDSRAAWEMAKQVCREGKKKGQISPHVIEEIAPRPRRILVEDITRERLAQILAENPRGLIMVHDELSDWLEGMNQYKSGGGNDRNIFLKIWSSSPITVDRKAQEDGVPITVSDPFLCISGGIQPDVLKRLSNGDRDDGFIDRFLFTYPEEIKMRWSWDSVDPLHKKAWTAAFMRLWDRRNYFEEYDTPHFAKFTQKALAKYADWYDREANDWASEGFPTHFQGVWSKYRTYAVRLALILEQLAWAYDPKSGEKIPQVGVEAIDGALSLIDYFKSHFRRVHAKIHGGEKSENLLAIDLLTWCTKHERTRFRESEARDNFRRRLTGNPHELDSAIRWLISRRCIRRISLSQRTSGRTPSPTYEVNPHLFSEKRPLNTGNSGTQEESRP